MKRRTLADWKQIIERHAESGQPISVFCKENNLPTSNFYKYRNKLEQNKPSAPFVKALVIDAKPIVSTQMLLTYGEAELSLNTNCEPSWLANFIKALSRMKMFIGVPDVIGHQPMDVKNSTVT